jgi:hypothetical protein
MKRTILSIALALSVGCVFGQSKEFKLLADIEGVESIHIGKSMLNMVAKNEGANFALGEGVSFDMEGADFLKKIDDIHIYSTEDKDAASLMSKHVKGVLDGKGWNPLIDMKDEDGQKVKMYQSKQGEQSTMVIFVEKDVEASLIVITGKVDFAELMAQKMKEAGEAQKMSLSAKTHTWEDDDENEKKPRKYRDCLIVIDGKVYPDLHTQDEAVRYMFDHNMGWSGSPKDMNVLEGKDVKKKYPDSKKKMAFEYTTSKGQEGVD